MKRKLLQLIAAGTTYAGAYGWLSSAVNNYLRGNIDKETLRKRLEAAEEAVRTGTDHIADIATRIDAEAER